MERKMDVKKMEETLRATAITKATDAAIAVATALETGSTATARKTAISKATEAAKARSAVTSTGAKQKEVAKSRGKNSKYKPKNVATASEAAAKSTTCTTGQSTTVTASDMRKIRAAKSTPTRARHTKTTIKTEAEAGTLRKETIAAKPEGAVAAATAAAVTAGPALAAAPGPALAAAPGPALAPGPGPAPAFRPAPVAAGVGMYATNSCEENVEVEIFTDGEKSLNRWKSCEKNPGHTKFIQASKFSMRQLPKAYRKEIYLKGIHDIATLTVKLRVNFVSKDRPDSDPRARYRGQKILTIGTGLVRGFSYSAKKCEIDAGRIRTGKRLYEINDFEIDTGGYDIPGHMQYKIDADSFKRAYGSISPDTCLQMIKSLRAKQGLNGTDDSFGMDDEDGDIADEDKETLLACEEDDVTDGRDETDFDDVTKNDEADHDCTSDSDDEIQDDDIISEFSRLNGTMETVEPCSCPECLECKTPEPRGYYVNILTARQVVHDSEEAKHTTADLFYDDEKEKSVKHVYGLRSCIISSEGGWSLLVCVTHDYTLVRKLRRRVNSMVRKVQRMHKQSTSALAVICSHPHGNVKQISLGPWTHRQLSPRIRPAIGTFYGYEAPTCPGSSGAAVLLLGCRPGTRVLESGLHPHLGTAAVSSPFPTGLNMSGRGGSEDRPLSNLPDSVVVKVLRQYEDIVRKEKNILKRSTGELDLAVVPHRTERLQDYIKYLSNKKGRSEKRK